MQAAAVFVDPATKHPFTFVSMVCLVLLFGVGSVAKETGVSSVKPAAFLNLWMAAYLLLLGILMSVTTAMALVLIYKADGNSNIPFVPPSFLPMTSAVLGVFGFEFLFRKFIIGFGESQFDLATTLQGFVDQAVAATLKKQAP